MMRYSDFAAGEIPAYLAVGCNHCGALIVLEDDPGEIPDEFEVTCVSCRRVGTHDKSSVLAAQADADALPST